MPKAIFMRDFNYRTPKKAIIAYKAGYKGNITQSAFDAASAAGVLEFRELPADGDKQIQSKEV